MTGASEASGTLSTARFGHRSVLLDDGRVLVIGGNDNSGEPAANAEVWDPTTGEFSLAGTLGTPRYGHSLTPLEDGSVLAIGGWGPAALTSIERWDPETATFSEIGTLLDARAFHSATLLADGTVLVVGGNSGAGDNTSAEIVDTTTGSTSPAGDMAVGREEHTAHPLPDGRVLIVAGWDSAFLKLASTEIWDPATASFAAGPPLVEGRGAHSGTTLDDGRVLVVGGYNGPASAELWDEASGWTPAGSMASSLTGHTATLLGDGTVLILGGTSDIAAPAEPSALSWTPALGGPLGSYTRGVEDPRHPAAAADQREAHGDVKPYLRLTQPLVRDTKRRSAPPSELGRGAGPHRRRVPGREGGPRTHGVRCLQLQQGDQRGQLRGPEVRPRGHGQQQHR